MFKVIFIGWNFYLSKTFFLFARNTYFTYHVGTQTKYYKYIPIMII